MSDNSSYRLQGIAYDSVLHRVVACDRANHRVFWIDDPLPESPGCWISETEGFLSDQDPDNRDHSQLSRIAITGNGTEYHDINRLNWIAQETTDNRIRFTAVDPKYGNALRQEIMSPETGDISDIRMASDDFSTMHVVYRVPTVLGGWKILWNSNGLLMSGTGEERVPDRFDFPFDVDVVPPVWTPTWSPLENCAVIAPCAACRCGSGRESPGLIMSKIAVTILLLVIMIDVHCHGISEWFQLTPEYSPPPMDSHNMVFDEIQEKCFLYGGIQINTDRVYGIFQYDGYNWSEIEPFGDWPSFRANFGMAFDPIRGVVVIFGGWYQGFDYLGDTWEWDGTQWIEMNPVNRPTNRLGVGMVYLPNLSKAILYGGYDESPNYQNDTWTWDGVDWEMIICPDTPDPRCLFGMTYDDHRQVIVVFGGLGEDGVRLNDTWEFDGETWNEINTEHRPGVRSQTSMVYDKKRSRSVLFSGTAPGDFWEDTWEYDGTDWTEIDIHPQPVGRDNTAMCYDSIRERIVLFGGYAWGDLNDTWEYYEPPTPTPTVTPTAPPTMTPTPSPSPTSSSTPPCPLGVTLTMPSHLFQPGDPCSLTATLCNPSAVPITQTPFFCILDILGDYWFYPSWSSDPDGVVLDSVAPGTTDIDLIASFNWPDHAGSFDHARFIAAMTDPSVTSILGVSGEWIFSWSQL